MANKYMGNMTFGVNFKVDTKALDQLDTKFSQMSIDLRNLMEKGTATKDNALIKVAKDARVAYDQLYEAMNKAYNPKLGQFDLSKVNASLQSVGTNLTSVASALNGAGQNVNGILSTLMGNKLMIKETNQFLDKMAITFGNTIRWSITNKIINTITGSIQKAFYFTKDLDRSLNDIRIVTGKSADEMERFAKQATNAAQALGKTTTDYTKASLIYYQQGLGDREVAARTETTLKAANVTGQSTSEVSEQLTAVWNGYKVSAAETELYVDKLAKVASSTASDLEELSTGMSKVAAAANMMGVDIDQLNAQLSTVISVTRQAPETIGAAFKTVYARMSTIQAGGIDEEDGATLKSYTEKMNQFGISVLDSNGKLRNMGEVIEEIGDKWNTFSREAQVGLAQAMGGTRQYSNLTALFENWDKYQAALKVSQNATGTLQKQQEIYMDSVAAHFKQLTAETEKFYQVLLDEDVLKDVADGLKFIVQEINAMVKGLGGGRNALINFGATVVNLFSNQIGKSLGGFINQRNELAISQQNVDTKAAMVKFYGGDVQLNRRQQKIYNNFNEQEEQQKLQDQFFNTTQRKVQLSNGQSDVKNVKEANDTESLFLSNKVLKEQAQNEAKLLNIAKQLGTEEYNKLTTLNSQLAVMNATKENYELVDKEVQNVLKTTESLNNVSDVANFLETENLETLRQQKKELEDEMEIKRDMQGDTAGHYSGEEEDLDDLNLLSERIKAYEALQNYQPQIHGLATGDYEDVSRQAQQMQGQIDRQAMAAQTIKNTQAAFKTATGVIKAATAAFGGLQVAADKSKTALERVNGGWEGFTGALTGGIMAVNPAIGMLVGSVLSLGKSILDATGLTEEFAERFKSETEKMEDSRNAIIQATEALDELNQKASEQRNLTITYNQQMKSLVDMQGAWDKLTNKMRAGISLTKEEKAEYESIKETLIGLNDSVIEGYDGQHTAIINNNTALGDTIKKLKEEYDIQSEINNISGKDQLNALQNSYIAERDYNENKKALEASENKDTLQGLLNLWSQGQILDVSRGEGSAFGVTGKGKIISSANRNDIGEGSEFRKNYAVEATTIQRFGQTYANDMDTLMAELNSSTVETLISAIETAGKKASGGSIFADSDDYEDVFEWMRQVAKNNDNKEITDLERAREDTLDNFTEDFVASLSDDVLPQVNSTIGENIVKSFGSSTYSANIHEIGAEDLTEENKQNVEEVTKQATKEYAQLINSYSDEIEKASQRFGKVSMDSNLSLLEYSQSLERIRQSLPDQLKEDSNILNNVFGSTENPLSYITDQLSQLGEGGGVNLLLRPQIDTEELNKVGYDAGEGMATVFTHTFTNGTQEELGEDLVAMNFTPIMVDENGKYLGVMAPDEFEQYCEDVVNGVRSDDLKLQIGSEFIGSDAIERAEADAELIHELHEDLMNASIISKDDAAKYIEFIKSTKDYSSYGDDILSQFEGFKSENYGFTLYKDAISDISSSIDEIKNLSLDGSALDEEKFEELVGQLDKYKGHLEELGTEIKIVSDSQLYGSQVWLESLKRVEAELEKVQANNLLADRKNFAINIEADTADAKETINDLINQDYSIMINIQAQGADTYETAVKDIENLKTALSYVGEEGKVAAKDVLGLLNAFPELNDMVQNSIKNDGTIALTKQQIELIKERTQVDIAGTVSAAEMELQTQLNRAEQEQKLTEAQIEMVEQELENFSDSQEAKEDFVKRFSGLYADYSDAQVEITETNNDVINTDTWETADAITNYWVDAYSNANTAYLDFVKNVIEGNKAMQGLENNFDPSNTIVNSGIREQKLNGSSATLSQDILDRVNQAQEEGEYKKALEESLAALRSKYQLNKKITEEIKNEMLALNVQGLEATKNAKDIGKKTKEAAWEAKHLYDYYHDVNKELDFINQKLTVLQKKQKLLEGNALLKNLKLQSKEYENQIKYLQQKRGIQEGYQQELQTRQKDELGNKGLAAYGVTFDKNGYIENYAEIAKKLQEGQHDKESVEDYQNFINQVKTYEENLKLALDLEGQLYDVVAKRQELQSKAVEERVKMILDISEARKKYMEFTKELGNWKVNLIINPDQTAVDAATAKAAESFVEDSITAMEKSANMVKKGNSAVDRLKAGDFDVDKKGNKTDYVKFNGQKYKMEDLLKLEEDVDKFADAASQSAADIQQAYQNTLDAYSNAMKELNDWDKRVLAKYDMINGVYDHAEKLTELWYGKDSLEAQIMLTANQQDKTDNLYAKAKEANEQVKEDWDIYQDAVLQGNEKLAEEAYDAWAESVQNLQSLTEQFAEQRKKQLTDELDLAAKIVETQLYGGKSRDEFKNSWELINKQAETYLDTINAQFGVTQLENKYLQAINKSIGNTKSQEKLNKIMNEEMKMLKEKDKLTKYDLERAEAKYDLTLKQMALEEARDNKTNLRLRRDSQGNYTYQYVADENDVLKAQNDVDIAKNNLYNMDRDRAQEMTEKQLSAEEEYAQKYADLQEQFIDDEEGRLAAEAELYDAYYGENGILTGIMNERGVAFENLNESIDESLNGTGEKTVLGSFEKLRQNLPEEISKLAPALDPSIKTVMDKWTNKETGVASAYKILTDDTKQFFEDYKADIEQFAKDIDQDSTFGKVRTTFDTVKTKVDEFKASAAEADTAIGQLNSTGSKFSLNTLITDFETLASDLGGANDENGLIYRINQANSELMELVNPEEKKNNFKEIRESLAKIRTTLEKNKDKFDWSLNEIDKWKQAVVGHVQDAETEIGLVKNALDALADKKVTVTVETVYTTKGSPSKESGGNSGGGGNTQNLDNLNGNDKKEPVATVYNVKNLNNSLGGNYTFEDKSAAEAYVKQYPDAGPVTKQQVYKGDGVYLYKNIVTHSGMNSLPIVAKIPDFDQYKKFDTGGYTGVWGDQGKLALLHEKELVLNKQDTQKFLDALDIVRQLDIGNLESNMYESFLLAQKKIVGEWSAPENQSATIQNITINADFPDASDRDEIKAAFDSLVNLASQRAYTKKY